MQKMIHDVPKPQTGLGFDALVAQLLPDLKKHVMKIYIVVIRRSAESLFDGLYGTVDMGIYIEI